MGIWFKKDLTNLLTDNNDFNTLFEGWFMKVMKPASFFTAIALEFLWIITNPP